MEDLTNKTEKELREVKMDFPKTLEELNTIIKQLTERKHDYGTCVYAMSLAAEATFNYVSGVLGCTGFQASCADMDFLSRTRGMKNGFRILDYDKLLYPQYFDNEHFPTKEQLLEENKKHLAEEARKRLAECGDLLHPDVKRWWEKLSALSN